MTSISERSGKLNEGGREHERRKSGSGRIVDGVGHDELTKDKKAKVTRTKIKDRLISELLYPSN
jgi:hypothetical protein